MADLLTGVTPTPDTSKTVVLSPVGSAGPPSPPYPTAMKETALVFLENPLARRLAVAWETTGGDEEVWVDAAGVLQAELADAHRLCRALRLNGVCRDGGVTDPLALQYVQALVAEPIHRRIAGDKRKR